MGYDKYKDTNGVVWQVRQTGWKMLAYVPDGADPSYEPPATDQQQEMTPASFDPVGEAVGPSGEQQRVMFIDLTKDIETYAKAHRANVVLKVTASPPLPWWVWAGLAWLLLKRRR